MEKQRRNESKEQVSFDRGRSYQSEKQYSSALLFVGARSPKELMYLDNRTDDDFYVLPDGTEIKAIVPWYSTRLLRNMPKSNELVGYNIEHIKGTNFRRPWLGYVLAIGNTEGKTSQFRTFSRKLSDLSELVIRAEQELPKTLQNHGIKCTKDEVKTYFDVVELASLT